MFKAKDNGFCMRHQKNEKDYEEGGKCQANSYSIEKWLDLNHVKKEVIKFVECDHASTIVKSDVQRRGKKRKTITGFTLN